MLSNWSKERVEQVLQEKEWLREQRPIQNGTQFILVDGTPIDCYTTGRVVVRGRETEIQIKAKEIFDKSPSLRESPTTTATPSHIQPTAAPNRVFIVYGRDVQAREQLELILRRLRLEPIVLQNIPGNGDTLIEKLETLTDADFACVLLTPDDKGHLAKKPEEIKFRARQNVVLELGMVLAKLGRSRVAILVKGEGLEKPSDIDGLIYIPFSERVDEVKVTLAANLQKAKFDIQLENLV